MNRVCISSLAIWRNYWKGIVPFSVTGPGCGGRVEVLTIRNLYNRRFFSIRIMVLNEGTSESNKRRFFRYLLKSALFGGNKGRISDYNKKNHSFSWFLSK